MRPGQIRVFDGLRVTTEHVDHFQASLHSAIQDIREILGLGAVFAGLDVAVSGPNTVTVQPGLAFDRAKNRVICDEAQQLTVAFAGDQPAAYVCARYDQIEGGETEGRKTLIWDSCALAVRPEPPDPKENVLPLAMITRNADGTLAVSDLTVPVSVEPAVEVKPEPAAPPAEWSVRQGVLDLQATSAGVPVNVASLLSSAATGSSTASAEGVISAPLAAVQFPAGFTWSSVTCYPVLSATVNLPAAAAPAAEPAVTDPAAPAAPTPSSGPRIDLPLKASSTGEATIDAGTVSQFAMAASGAVPALTEGAVFSLPLGSPTSAAAATIADELNVLLGRLRLRVRVEPSGGAAIAAVVHLTWEGAWSEQEAQRLAEFKPMLTWTGRLAWKALGRPTTST